MFERSYFYIADGSYLPTANEDEDGLVLDEGCWNNHLGGMEGLRQKGWTIFTIAILRYAADQMRVRCKIMGQGDNQVLICDHPSTDSVTVQEMHDQFAKSLYGLLKRIGPLP